MYLFVLISFYRRAIQFVDAHLLACPSRKYLHLQCPGCGLQRSCIALLRGDVAGSFKLYPATIPLLLLMGVLLLHLLFRFSKGAAVIRILYFFCVAVILLHYLYIIGSNQLIAA